MHNFQQSMCARSSIDIGKSVNVCMFVVQRSC